MKQKGFTLIELLTVLAIIALLIAILLPVIISARKRAQIAPCISNLKQIHSAWSLYREDHQDQWAKDLKALITQANKSIFRCPLDQYGGLSRRQSEAASTAVSYYYMNTNPQFRQALSENDPNHGIIACILHGEIKKEAALKMGFPYASVGTEGQVLRLRLDGSVQNIPIPIACFDNQSPGYMAGRPEWYLMTDVRPCPKPWCPHAEVPCPH